VDVTDTQSITQCEYVICVPALSWLICSESLKCPKLKTQNVQLFTSKSETTVLIKPAPQKTAIRSKETIESVRIWQTIMNAAHQTINNKWTTTKLKLS
jgi:hypothetical protein